jgi:hypothetical protein
VGFEVQISFKELPFQAGEIYLLCTIVLGIRNHGGQHWKTRRLNKQQSFQQAKSEGRVEPSSDKG